MYFQPNPLTQKDWNIEGVDWRGRKPTHFQPNPLTQKDWNWLNEILPDGDYVLPTKSIDSEGLKLVSLLNSLKRLIFFQPNPLTQKDWN